MKTGNTVRVVQPVISGEIVDTQYNKSSNELEHLVSWSDDGGEHQRWFSEAQLEEVV